MKFIKEYMIHEVSYKYESEKEKEFHQKHMISAGFTIASKQPIFTGNSLTVTYQKRQLMDGVPRL